MFHIFALINRDLPNNHLRPDRPLWQRNAEFFVKVYVILRFYAFLRYTLAIKRLFFRQSLKVDWLWLQIPVSRAFKAAPREYKQVSIPLDLHINSNFADGFLLSIEMAVFVDGNGKMSTLSIKRGVFMDGSRGYLLYLYDLTENIN